MSHASNQPTEQQLKPLMEKHRATWKWLTSMMLWSVIAIFAVLGLMALFIA